MIESENSFHITVSSNETGGSEMANEQENFVTVSKIYLLVHPGFCADPRESGTDKFEQQYQPLLKLYLEKAEEISQDAGAIMITFATQNFAMMREDLKENSAYGIFFRELRSILGRRLIVVSSKQDALEDPSVPRYAIQLAKSRGFQIDQDVDTEVFGETSSECVLDAGCNFNKALGLTKKTKLNIGLTELPTEDDYSPENSVDSVEHDIGRYGREQFIEVLR